MEVVRPQLPFINEYFSEPLPAPAEVRGLSLDELSAHYSTRGLYVRLQTDLAEYDLDSPAMQTAIELGLTVHAGDRRTYQPYGDHLLEVTLMMIEQYGIRDEAMVAAGPMHDSLEDHPREVVQYFGGEWIDDETEAMVAGRQAIAERVGKEPAELVWLVTNRPLAPGTTRAQANAAYGHRLRTQILPHPKARVLKLADFDRNGVNNHLTQGPKQRTLDEKYINFFDDHTKALLRPDSLITGLQREIAQRRLTGGKARAVARLAVAGAQRAI